MVLVHSSGFPCVCIVIKTIRQYKVVKRMQEKPWAYTSTGLLKYTLHTTRQTYRLVACQGQFLLGFPWFVYFRAFPVLTYLEPYIKVYLGHTKHGIEVLASLRGFRVIQPKVIGLPTMKSRIITVVIILC